jgi:hypothetical protein
MSPPMKLSANPSAYTPFSSRDELTTRKELSEQIVGLRRAVIDYHTSVIGRGVIISELEVRVRRVEQHLNLPSLHPT